MEDLLEYTLLFLVGGLTLVGIKYASMYVSPILGGIIGALPIGLFSAYFLINENRISPYLKQYIKQTTLTLALASLYLYGLETFDDKIIYTFVILIWIIFSYLRTL